MKVIKATKKPVTITAIEWNGCIESTRRVLLFMGKSVETNCEKSKGAFCAYHQSCIENGLIVENLEDGKNGQVKQGYWARVGDYIIEGVNGEFYPCKPDIFHKTYSIEN